ncbi:hypothetical protein LINPERHAP1_LOCUS19572 [Linum perenne]
MVKLNGEVGEANPSHQLVREFVRYPERVVPSMNDKVDNMQLASRFPDRMKSLTKERIAN